MRWLRPILPAAFLEMTLDTIIDSFAPSLPDADPRSLIVDLKMIEDQASKPDTGIMGTGELVIEFQKRKPEGSNEGAG